MAVAAAEVDVLVDETTTTDEAREEDTTTDEAREEDTTMAEELTTVPLHVPKEALQPVPQ